MELKINDLDETLYQMEDNFNNYHNQPIQSSFEQIPENTVPIKVIKKGVHFNENTIQSLKPIHQSIPKVNAKIVRPQIPPEKPKISYEDILSKMGMLVSDGKLHLIDRNNLTPQKKQELLNSQRQNYERSRQEYQNTQQMNNIKSIDDSNIPKNSYIYNKFFKDEIQPQNTVRRPRTMEEYKRMLFEEQIQKYRIKQIKSTKLIMPTSNINISSRNSANLNKLFNFSKR